MTSVRVGGGPFSSVKPEAGDPPGREDGKIHCGEYIFIHRCARVHKYIQISFITSFQNLCLPQSNRYANS